MYRSLIVGAVLAVSAPLACNAAEPELDTYDFGGALFTSWTSRNPHEGHSALIAITNKQRVRDVSYRVLASNGGAAAVLAEGTIKNLREDSHQILTSQKQPIPNHAELTVCMTYYNIGRGQHFASVSFYREPDIVGAGRVQYTAGPSTEMAVPIRLRHDGSLTCQALLEPSRLQAYLNQDRLPRPTADTKSQAERSDNPDNISVLSLHTSLLERTRHVMHGMISAPEDVADVDYRIRVTDPTSSPGPKEWSGKIPFINQHTGIDVTINNPDGNREARLPSDNVTLAVCVTYYQLSEKRYVREQWDAFADYKKVLSFKDTTLPQSAFPKGNVVLEHSTAPLACAAG